MFNVGAGRMTGYAGADVLNVAATLKSGE